MGRSILSNRASSIQQMRVALDAMQTRYELIVETASEGIWTMDALQRTDYINPRGAEILGYTVSEMIGRSPLEFQFPEDQLSVAEHLEQRREAIPSERDLRLRRKDGSACWVHATSRPIMDSKGHYAGAVFMFQDITDRRRAEESLHQAMEEIRRLNADLEHRVAERTAELERTNDALNEEITTHELTEEALRESEERYRILFETSPDAIIVAERSGANRILAANSAACHLFGYTEEELLRQDGETLLDTHGLNLGSVLGSGDTGKAAIELVCKRKDGTRFTAELTAAHLQDKRGTCRVMVIIRDVSARKRTELEIRQLYHDLEDRAAQVEAERARWQSVVQGIADEVWIADTQGRISLINLPQVTAMGLEEFTNKTVEEIYQEVDILNPNGEMRAYADAPLLKALKGEVVRGEEIMRHRRTGIERYREYSAAPTRSTSGVVTGAVAIVRDITEYKRSEQIVRDSEARYRSLVELTPSGIALHARGKILFANRAAAQIVGLTDPSTVIGRSIFDFVHPDSLPAVIERARASSEEHQAAPWIEEKFVRVDGQVVDVEAASIPTIYEGMPATQVVMRNITDRKRAAEEIERLNRDLEMHASELEWANRELEAFSYSVSHDLRTPLAAVDGFARVLQDLEGVDSEAQRYAALIRSAARQMSELISSLLDLSRLSRQTVKKQTVNMNELVREVLDGLPEETRRGQEELVLRDLPDSDADPVLLKQVWVNLISNALKFTRGCDKPVVEIGSWKMEDRNSRLDRSGLEEPAGETPTNLQHLGSNFQLPVYYVRDNGVGFDMSQADRLFGVFQRLHAPEQYEGTGVGLAIVRQIIQRHGGRVWAQAQPGQGATFFFTLG